VAGTAQTAVGALAGVVVSTLPVAPATAIAIVAAAAAGGALALLPLARRAREPGVEDLAEIAPLG
jgi:hypothetical protein